VNYQKVVDEREHANRHSRDLLHVLSQARDKISDLTVRLDDSISMNRIYAERIQEVEQESSSRAAKSRAEVANLQEQLHQCKEKNRLYRGRIKKLERAGKASEEAVKPEIKRSSPSRVRTSSRVRTKTKQ
jgi:predicted  nucleic acid-binding Zn-ribbon protein